jgi:hypothetical protein
LIVSGFLISPNDHERIFSGLAIADLDLVERLRLNDRIEQVHDLLIHHRLLGALIGQDRGLRLGGSRASGVNDGRANDAREPAVSA